MKSSKGFTLIELLVVVAIIAILSATILVALGSARGKARLSRAQSELSSMRAAAELYYSDHNSYDDGTKLFVDSSSGMGNLVTSVAAYANSVGGTVSMVDSGSAWAYGFTTGSATGSTIYCADSNGYSGKSSALPDGNNVQCTPII